MANIARSVCIVWASLIEGYFLVIYNALGGLLHYTLIEVRILLCFLGCLYLLAIYPLSVVFFIVKNDSDSFMYKYYCGL